MSDLSSLVGVTLHLIPFTASADLNASRNMLAHVFNIPPDVDNVQRDQIGDIPLRKSLCPRNVDSIRIRDIQLPDYENIEERLISILDSARNDDLGVGQRKHMIVLELNGKDLTKNGYLTEFWSYVFGEESTLALANRLKTAIRGLTTYFSSSTNVISKHILIVVTGREHLDIRGEKEEKHLVWSDSIEETAKQNLSRTRQVHVWLRLFMGAPHVNLLLIPEKRWEEDDTIRCRKQIYEIL